MKIEVNVQAEELVTALNNLATAMGSTPQVAATSEPKKEESKKSIKNKKKKDEPKKDKPKEEKEPEVKEEKAPEKDEVPSVEDVRAKTAEAAKAGKKEEVKDLLAEIGVSVVSKIPEDQRAEYLEKLAEL
ncbi:hypothetical protein [Oceanobacillus kimchii]|uniref:hypothetical protein n=1 Tax=Oceanobacillus kimchii TaxID=746691 RepID=UPI003B014726